MFEISKQQSRQQLMIDEDTFLNYNNQSYLCVADQSDTSNNASVPCPKTHHSEQKCTHSFSILHGEV